MYINANFDKIKHIYDVERLKQYNSSCERDIKRLEGIIEKIKKYQMEIFKHAQHVVNTEMKNVVTLVRRKEYATKRVKYNVQLEVWPIIPMKHVENERVYGAYKHEKMFGGKERHLALKYANDLAETYHCEIERKGF
ncbi:hypothetical protein [Bacillus gaemokensis]|uniref:Uncharacterized protein n=1 Tax=Bacillus gaemokensis TaxID=574375 RepID=A0A073K6D7_9BACI|nr:hypothetical protein [Bacillus gaemokensis]KEK22135.1 hypothetical protein BAGA_20875 [Bacillus gaemokensis]KYG35572.1 hypothetical protein AZF08_26210 [Bacillus gaemokensis]